MTTKSRHSDNRSILVSLMGSGAREAVLRVFMLDPHRAYYQRQLESVTGHPIRAVQRELERLMDAELLYRRMEGNRAYYQIDLEHALFQELRSLFLKTGSAQERLRANLAVNSEVRLAFLSADGSRVLVVVHDEPATEISHSEFPDLTQMTTSAFTAKLSDDAESLTEFLRDGSDLLGRRDDIIWRRIEQASFDVKKGQGVP